MDTFFGDSDPAESHSVVVVCVGGRSEASLTFLAIAITHHANLFQMPFRQRAVGLYEQAA